MIPSTSAFISSMSASYWRASFLAKRFCTGSRVTIDKVVPSARPNATRKLSSSSRSKLSNRCPNPAIAIESSVRRVMSSATSTSVPLRARHLATSWSHTSTIRSK